MTQLLLVGHAAQIHIVAPLLTESTAGNTQLHHSLVSPQVLQLVVKNIMAE